MIFKKKSKKIQEGKFQKWEIEKKNGHFFWFSGVLEVLERSLLMRYEATFLEISRNQPSIFSEKDDRSEKKDDNPIILLFTHV